MEKKTGDKSLDHVSFDKDAAKIFKDMITKENFDDFLTLPLYENLIFNYRSSIFKS